MLKHLFLMGFAIASTSMPIGVAIAGPLSIPSNPEVGATVRVETNAPICYIQFQGSSTIDVSRVCGKKPRETSANKTAVSLSNAVVPPVFDPKAVNASTTGQCNFVDANGNPCSSK